VVDGKERLGVGQKLALIGLEGSNAQAAVIGRACGTGVVIGEAVLLVEL
jgi:hypothetical protein